jgi:hypothetical protein
LSQLVYDKKGSTSFRYLYSMKKVLFIFFITQLATAQISNSAQHCGYDFVSYLVVNPRVEASKETIKGLKISLVDVNGNPIINTDNKLSWKDNNKELDFTLNYLIDEQNKRIATVKEGDAERWYFPYAKETYFLSVVNGINTDELKIKIEDIDGTANGGLFQTQIIDISPFDLFVLCTNQIRDYSMKFGRKGNKPIEVFLIKK